MQVAEGLEPVALLRSERRRSGFRPGQRSASAREGACRMKFGFRSAEISIFLLKKGVDQTRCMLPVANIGRALPSWWRWQRCRSGVPLFGSGAVGEPFTLMP